jgi:hypothetical protein
MSRDKQIEEMTELERLLRIRRMDIEKQGYDIWSLIKKTESEEQSIADYLIGQGYRKTSEVAREIFAEIEKCRVVGCYDIHCYLKDDIDELKKKYTEAGK